MTQWFILQTEVSKSYSHHGWVPPALLYRIRKKLNWITKLLGHGIARVASEPCSHLQAWLYSFNWKRHSTKWIYVALIRKSIQYFSSFPKGRKFLLKVWSKPSHRSIAMKVYLYLIAQNPLLSPFGETEQILQSNCISITYWWFL